MAKNTERRTYRLGCCRCYRDDFDNLTRAEFRRAIASGWRDVSREQTYAQACKTYDNPADEPPGYSVLDWWTHLGMCPDCAAEGDSRATA